MSDKLLNFASREQEGDEVKDHGSLILILRLFKNIKTKNQ
jgi:hypothetical protein